MNVMITNQSRFFIDESKMKSLAERVLLNEGAENKEISIAFVSNSEIKKINNDYRNLNEITDVLSFSHNGEGLKGTGIDLIGEVIISPQKVFQDGSSIERVLIHGILHLLGYDHKTDFEEDLMREKESFYLSSDLKKG
ncbi:MAG: rRNA maturation RNase YbeY [Minisyncoccales bacterium]|jgi:probable rRNA maturation factor